MRAVIQRVSRASVSVDGEVKGEVSRGLLLYLGVSVDDGEEDLSWLVPKIVSLRIFEDEEGKMNKSVKDADGGILVISQFTLFGNVKKGTRPSFNAAAPPEIAAQLYEKAIAELGRELGKEVPSGVFGATMEIDSINDGPVTIIIDSKNRKF